MIIGNNKQNNQGNEIKPQNFTDDINQKQYTNVLSKNDMADKSLAMLQERYRQGLISLDEFTKQCNKLNKIRRK